MREQTNTFGESEFWASSSIGHYLCFYLLAFERRAGLHILQHPLLTRKVQHFFFFVFFFFCEKKGGFGGGAGKGGGGGGLN